MNASHKLAYTERERKRNAILDAAALCVALHGMGAQTEEIARQAGVSKGTLFLYFSSKEDLFIGLHRCLENELVSLIAATYPAHASIERQFRHTWECYFEWSWRSDAKHKALRQLEMSSRFQKSTYGNALFSAINSVASSANQHSIPSNQAAAFLFLCNVMESIVTTVLEMIAINPGGFEELKSLGWITFWGAASACISTQW